MSLQVWLPFTKDISNQGLSSVVSINGGATIDTSGKLGSCYSFTGSNYVALPTVILPSKTANWSFSCWFYLADITTTTAECLFSERTGTNYNGYSIFLYPNNGKMLIDDGVRWTVTPMTFAATTWYHLVITRSPQGKALYINGELKASTTTVGNTTAINTNGCLIGLGQNNSTLTAGGQGFKGKLNDVRIYDHTLSIKEIKELAKGLVLHYKLDSPKTFMPNTISNENLLIGTGYSQNVIDTMVSNSSTDWTCSFRWYNGSKAIHTFSDGVDTIRLNATGNLGIAFVRKATDINLDSNSYYTLSCEAKCTKSGAQLGIGTSYYKNNNSWTWRGGANKFSFSAVDTWQTFKYTFKPDADTQYICYCFTCANGTSGGTDTFSIRHCKLEKGSTATAWQLNPAEEGYSTSIIPDNMWNIEYDCSGYGNHANIIGTPTVDDTSGRFNSALHMTNSGTANRIESQSPINIGTDALTMSFWGKFDKTKSQIIVADKKIEWATNTSDYAWVSSTSLKGFSLANFVNNAWNHIVVVRTGSTYQMYINGQAAAQNGSNNNWTHNSDNLYLLNRNYNNNYAADASIADFRIYATAFSAEDVLELYNTSASIDNNGNGYAREIIENNGNVNITKAGQWRVNELIDDDGNTTASITKSNKELKVNTFYEY